MATDVGCYVELSVPHYQSRATTNEGRGIWSHHRPFFVGKYGITVNAITVGLTATQMPNAGNDRISKSLLEHILPAQCVRRSDEPEDVANIVAFLALPASGMITGQTINVDGGIARH